MKKGLCEVLCTNDRIGNIYIYETSKERAIKRLKVLYLYGDFQYKDLNVRRAITRG